MRIRTKLISVIVGSLMVAATQAEPAPIRAVWKPAKFTLTYFSPTTYYSCDSLEAKMQRIVKQLGLIGEVHVRAADCGRGVVSMPNIHIEALVPAEATPEVIDELKKDAGYRDLIERLNGKREQKISAGEEFPAQWRDVQVGRGLNLTSTDCDLLRQVQRQLLPKLAVKVKETNRTCDSRDPGGVREPYLDLRVLQPLPTPDKQAH